MAGEKNNQVDWFDGLLTQLNPINLFPQKTQDPAPAQEAPTPAPARAPAPAKAPAAPAPAQAPAPAPARVPAPAPASAKDPDPARTRKTSAPPFLPSGLKRNATSPKKPELSDDQKLQQQKITDYIIEIGNKIENLKRLPTIEKPQLSEIDKLVVERNKIYKEIINPNFDKLLKEIEAKKAKEAEEAKMLEQNKRNKEEATKQKADKDQAQLQVIKDAELVLRESAFRSAQKRMASDRKVKLDSIKSDFDYVLKQTDETKENALNFLENRIGENHSLLSSIRPNKIDRINTFERSSYFVIPRAVYGAKVAVASVLGGTVGLVAATALLPVTGIVFSSEKNREMARETFQSLTPEFKNWEIPKDVERRGGIRGLENELSIFYKTQNTEESDKKVFTNLPLIKASAITEKAEYPEFRSDISKLNELKSSVFDKSGEILKLESKIEINKEQTRIKYLIGELEDHRKEEIELIKRNLKKGDTLVVKDLSPRDQTKVKTQVFKRASSIEAVIKRSFSFSASRDTANDDHRKLKQTQSLSSLKEVDGSSTQSLFFSSNSRTSEEVKKIQDGISKIDEGYKKEIDELTKASRNLATQATSLENNIKKYDESITKEKNIEILKELLDTKTNDPNEVEALKNLILEKYNEIVNGGIPTEGLGANSFQLVRGGRLYIATSQKTPSISSVAEKESAKEREENLLGKLDETQKKQLKSIIPEGNKDGPSKSLSALTGRAGRAGWVGRSAGGGGMPAEGGGMPAGGGRS